MADWQYIHKFKYLQAMERGPIKDLELRAHPIEPADKVNDREVIFNRIEQTYSYEEYKK